MKGFYFVNTDIDNTRAHTCQILNTALFIDKNLSIKIVAPKYHNQIDFKTIKERHSLPFVPKIKTLKNFGIKKPNILSFISFNLPAILFLFIKKLKKEVDFIYIRSSFFLLTAIFAYMIGVRIFYETHRKPVSFSEKVRDYFISKMSFGIVVISEYVKKYYLKYNKKILVIHDAVSLKRFDNKIDKKEAREKLGTDLNKKVCVYTGTISKLKGADYIFETARILQDVIFILVGQISSEFDINKLSKNIILFGKKEQKELPIILCSADVLLLPHPKNEYSQSPLKLFEYMASGVPIVASKLPSICEILNDKNAVLVEAENTKALAEGIRKVFDDKSNSEFIAKQALTDVQEYTWEKRGKKIADFIKNI